MKPDTRYPQGRIQVSEEVAGGPQCSRKGCRSPTRIHLELPPTRSDPCSRIKKMKSVGRRPSHLCEKRRKPDVVRRILKINLVISRRVDGEGDTVFLA